MEAKGLLELAADARRIADDSGFPRESWYRLESEKLTGVLLASVLHRLRWESNLVGFGTGFTECPPKTVEHGLKILLADVAADYVPQPPPDAA